MPDDSSIPGGVAEKVALNGSVLSTVQNGGAYGIRTRGLRLERAVSLATRRMRRWNPFWLGILDSNQGFQIQSLTSYR